MPLEAFTGGKLDKQKLELTSSMHDLEKKNKLYQTRLKIKKILPHTCREQKEEIKNTRNQEIGWKMKKKY